MYCNNYFSSPHTHTSFVHTHYNTEMEREERSRELPFRAERQSQEEMRRREELQQRVVEAERRAQEESRRADQAQQRATEMEWRAREMEGRVREENARANSAEQGSRQMAGRVREMEGRVREENARANRAEQGSRQLEGRVREMEGRVGEESERANRAEQGSRQLAGRVREMEGRVREENARANRAEQGSRQLEGRVREMEGRVGEESERANRAEQGSRQLEGRLREMEGRVREMEGRVREMEGRVREESERANRAEREANRRVTDVEQAAQHDRERAQVLQQQLHDAEARLRAADFWVVQSDDVHLTDEEIGRGGWAVVKVAHFRGLRVAAKSLHEDLVYPYHRNIFQREMSFAAKLRHPNLLQFIGATVEPAMIILTEVMPTSLRALVNRTRLTNKQIVSIALDVARALNYLHLMRPHPILHRDLSSANVLLEPTPDDGWRAKVSDYGTANFSQYLRTENPGSPVYSAPEARNPDLQSAKMDIYSFGVLLIEMCTSEFPVPEMRPRLIPTIAHAQLVALIRSCLAPDRHQRPRCSVVIERLDAIEL